MVGMEDHRGQDGCVDVCVAGTAEAQPWGTLEPQSVGLRVGGAVAVVVRGVERGVEGWQWSR